MKSQKDLVNYLIRSNYLSSERVKKVLLEVDRKDFINETPYIDFSQGIGFGATISAPHMHATALELLEPLIKENSKILDVGSGSGYLSVCLAKMISDFGKVVAIDHIKELTDLSKSNIQKNHSKLLESRLEIITGDGRLGYPAQSPYDLIHVGAAPENIPQTLIDQLVDGGRMVIPVGEYGNQKFLQIDKISDKKYNKKHIFNVSYVPLTSKEKQLESP